MADVSMARRADPSPGRPEAATPDDVDILAAARGRDPDAVAVLFERHHAVALRLARRLADPVTADDLVAEAFAKVLEAMYAGRGPATAFRPYLLTTLRRAWVDHVREDARHVWTADHAAAGVEPPVEDPTARREETRLLARAFASLPDRWRWVLWLTVVEGRDHLEVGTMLSISPNAVSGLAFRAREGLRQAYLAAHLPPPAGLGCAPVVRALPGYLRTRLHSLERGRVAAHLRACRACARAVAELEAVRVDVGAGSTTLGRLIGTGPRVAPAAVLCGEPR